MRTTEFRFEYQIISPSQLPKGSSFVSYFNEIGKDGWEFCSIYPQGNSFLFMRKILVDEP